MQETVLLERQFGVEMLIDQGGILGMGEMERNGEAGGKQEQTNDKPENLPENL
jgi:hypothetical protein